MSLFAHRRYTVALGLAVLLILGAVAPLCGSLAPQAMAMPMDTPAPASSDDCGSQGSMGTCPMSEEGVPTIRVIVNDQLAPAAEVLSPAVVPPAPIAAPPAIIAAAESPPATLTPLRI